MNPIIQSLFDRKSVRLFTDEAISPETKQLLFDCALQAPSAGNLTLYSILDITDPQVKVRLAETCDHQAFIAQAPLVLVFLADLQRLYDGYCTFVSDAAIPQPQEGELLLAFSDALIAAQNMVVAAEALGLGSCYIGDILENYEIHRELLDLPPFAIPAGMLVIGHPTEQSKNRRKPPRVDARHIVYENTYRALDPQEHETMFREQLAKNKLPARSAEAVYRELFGRKTDADFTREMNRSVHEMLKAFRKPKPLL